MHRHTHTTHLRNMQLGIPMCQVCAESMQIRLGEAIPGTSNIGDPRGLNGLGQSDGLVPFHGASGLISNQSSKAQTVDSHYKSYTSSKHEEQNLRV